MTRLAVSERRQKLLEAAAKVIVRDGLANTTTRAIAAEADMPRGMFHYAFESKDELLAELIKRHVTDMVGAACGEWRDERSLIENLKAGLRAIADIGMANPKEELISYELALHALRSASPTSAATQYQDYTRQATLYLQFVADKAGIHWSTPLRTVARMFATFVDGSMLYWLADRDTDNALAALDGFAELLAQMAATVTPTEDRRP